MYMYMYMHEPETDLLLTMMYVCQSGHIFIYFGATMRAIIIIMYVHVLYIRLCMSVQCGTALLLVVQFACWILVFMLTGCYVYFSVFSI